jgi:hypothetical protein
MNIPGFSAEGSLYKTKSSYRIMGSFSRPSMVTPALPPPSGGAPGGPGTAFNYCVQQQQQNCPAHYTFHQCYLWAANLCTTADPGYGPSLNTGGYDLVECAICTAACNGAKAFCAAELGPLAWLFCEFSCDCPKCIM